jgi:hypothetical protein
MIERKQKAIEMVANNRHTSEQIAKECHVTRRTITTWKADPLFQQAVKDRRVAWRHKARTEGPSDQDSRLRDVRSLRNRLWDAITKRGASEEMKDVPGGKSGLVCVTYKMQSMGEGLGSSKVPEYRIDSPVVDTLLRLYEHAATEKGQWQQKVEHSGSISIEETMAILRAGRQRVADAKAERDAAARDTARNPTA